MLPAHRHLHCSMFLLTPQIFHWDLAILTLIIVGIGMALMSALWIRQHRERSLLHRTAAGTVGCLGVILAFTVIYGSFIEPFWIVATKQDIPFPTQESLRIALIADLHIGPYKGRRFIERVVERINNELPDLVLIAGDFTFDGASDFAALEPLQFLRAPLGVFAVMGNHESGEYASLLGSTLVKEDQRDSLSAWLTHWNISVLRNRASIVHVSAQEMIAIAGVDDLWAGDADLEATLESLPNGLATILLAHNPDIVLNPRIRQAHLVAAGHTHGGQVRLPFLGPVPPLPTKLGRAYDHGLFPVDSDTWLAITRGLGETLARARLLAWPEIMILETQRAPSAGTPLP